METLIFSAIVMTLTAKTLGQRILALRQDTQTRVGGASCDIVIATHTAPSCIAVLLFQITVDYALG